MDIESGIGSSHHRATPVTNAHRTMEQWQATPVTNAHRTMEQWQASKRKIHKVPELLRQEERNSDAYDPKVVSFGPYHYGKEELKFCQEVKRFAFQLFVEDSKKDQEFFHNKVLEVIADARNCYVEGSTDNYTDAEFAEMMLLDAYFLIYCLNIGPQNQRTLIYGHLGGLVYSLVNRDIFLMENQIPFKILILLINLIYDDGETDKNMGEEAVNKFLHMSMWGQYKQQPFPEKQDQQPLHLFEASHRVIAWDWTPQNQAKKGEKENPDLKKHHKTFRSATDLKAKGIHFRASRNKSLKDIKFCSSILCGRLQLPTWFVTNLSKVFFLNMIAYELCPDNPVEMTVISYVNFMKSLIDSPADVKELREKRILLTKLGSDEEVVRLYRDLNTHGMSYIDNYKEVKQRIQEHYDSCAKTCTAQVINTHFSSCLSVVAWFTGVVLLILTFTQTYFAIYPND